MKYVKNRLQLYNPVDKHWIKINAETGKVLGCKKTLYKRIKKFNRKDLQA